MLNDFVTFMKRHYHPHHSYNQCFRQGQMRQDWQRAVTFGTKPFMEKMEREDPRQVQIVQIRKCSNNTIYSGSYILIVIVCIIILILNKITYLINQ